MKKKKPPLAELYPAWAWDCDHCGAQNFSRGIAREFVDKEAKAEAFREHYGLEAHDELPDDWEDMEQVLYPETVRCEECRRKFRAVPYSEPDEDDEVYLA